METPKPLYSFLGRVRVALHGIGFALRQERHMQVHATCLVVAVAMGLWLSISRLEWVAVLGISALVIGLELVNSAMEQVMDKLHPAFDPAIGIAKDMLAGAVLVAAVAAVFIGILVFGPYVWTIGNG
jgi:diacylglycerol kinase